jgi:hypothetical protein
VCEVCVWAGEVSCVCVYVCVCVCVYTDIRNTGTHTHFPSLSRTFSPLSHTSEHTPTPTPTPSPSPTSTHARMNQSINMRTCPTIGSSCTEIGTSVPTICLRNFPPKVSSVWDIAASFWGLSPQCRVKTWFTLATFYTMSHAN